MPRQRRSRDSRRSLDNFTLNGLLASGVECGIKKKGGRDLGVLAFADGSTTAAVFTQNAVRAAPVELSAANLRKSQGEIAAIVVNSGNANACTGQAGVAAAKEMATAIANAVGCAREQVLVCSTGVIGQPLPVANVRRGMLSACAALTDAGFAQFAEAILTTDKRAKLASRVVTIAGKEVRLIGCTKGAGMIMPNMATTLTFVVTDAQVAATALQDATEQSCDVSFNAIAVDGDTSTNDTLTVTATGASGARIGKVGSATWNQFAASLTELLTDLATQLMADGEGVNHVVSINVSGARNDADAKTIARRVAISPLVKTAIAGGDPNWGRILCAVGNAGVAVKPEALELDIAGIATVRAGAVVPKWAETKVAAAMKQTAYSIDVKIGKGKGAGHYLACDLSHGYVSINADYRS